MTAPVTVRRRYTWLWPLVVPAPVRGGMVTAGGIWLLSRAARAARAVHSAGSLPRELAAARAEGLPLTPRDLEPVHPVAARLNAALRYVQMARQVREKRSDPEDKCIVRVASGKGSLADRSATRRAIMRFAPELRLAVRAASLPDCDFHRDWSQGMNVRFMAFREMRAVARLLAAQRPSIRSTTGRCATAQRRQASCSTASVKT